MARGSSVLQPGIKPVFPAMDAQSPNHWMDHKGSLRRLFSFVIPPCHQNQKANQRTNTPYIYMVLPGLFQSSRKARSRQPRVRKRFRGTHNWSPQLQQDMVGVMGIRPWFTIFADIVGWAEAVRKGMAQWEVPKVRRYGPRLPYVCSITTEVGTWACHPHMPCLNPREWNEDINTSPIPISKDTLWEERYERVGNRETTFGDPISFWGT